MKKISRKKEVSPKPKNENPVYLRLMYNESLGSKKALLSSEILLLNIIKIMKRYNALRMEEFMVKTEMYKAIRQLESLMKKTKSSFPFLKIPENIQREKIAKMKKNVEKTMPRKILDEDLESQLRDIQEKLRSIG